MRNRYHIHLVYSTGHCEGLISNIIMADRKLLSPDRAKGKKNMGQGDFGTYIGPVYQKKFLVKF